LLILPTEGYSRPLHPKLEVKLVVIYPRPKDVDDFEKVYQQEHVPPAVAKIVATKILASPRGTLLFTALPKFTFRRCKPWKHAQRLKAVKRHSLTL